MPSVRAPMVRSIILSSPLHHPFLVVLPFPFPPFSLHPFSPRLISASPKRFFNVQTGVCQQFSFGSCGGNANNFPDQINCEAVCLPFPPVNRKDLPARCTLERDEGLGGGYHAQWYFNMRNLRLVELGMEGRRLWCCAFANFPFLFQLVGREKEGRGRRGTVLRKSALTGLGFFLPDSRG